MPRALRNPMSVAGFLAWEERQELRYEFDGVQAVAVTDGTLAHDAITFNLRRALDARLGKGRCSAHGPNVKILTADRIRYPDGVVTCTAQIPTHTIVDAPIVVFEVVSQGSSRTDRIDKLRDCLSASSIQRYVILEQDSAAATVFVRAGGVWQVRTVTGADDLEMPEIGISMPIAACYAGLDLPATD